MGYSPPPNRPPYDGDRSNRRGLILTVTFGAALVFFVRAYL